MTVLITGGTGFIGSALCERLLVEGHRVAVLTRDRQRAAERFRNRVRAIEDPAELDRPPDVMINLAGRSLGSGRWNPALKREFIASRVDTTRRLIDTIGSVSPRPRLLISGSAVGYYGARGDEELDEDSSPGDEYQSELCRAWEAEALRAEDLGVRVCRLRMGVVLGPDGGALSSLLPPFRLGLGAWLGDGRQWMSWIHRDDLIGVVRFLMAHDELSGAFNVTAPQPQTNRDFAVTLGRVLHRPVLLRIPGWAVRLQVGGMAHLFLTGQKVLPRRLLAAGYRFEFPTLDAALAAVTRG